MVKDTSLQEKIRQVLREDKELRSYNLHADVRDGEVQLQGIVDTLIDKQKAEDLVSQVPGVKGIANALSISTDGAIRGEDVSFEASEELELDPRVNQRHIGAISYGGNGTIVLHGRTADPAELEAAREAASKARGVTRVLSQVKMGERERGLEEIFHSQVNNDGEE